MVQGDRVQANRYTENRVNTDECYGKRNKQENVRG